MDELLKPLKRKRGAPVGNTNALKHGFYSTRFKSREIHDLDEISENNLQDEILMLRVFIRRILDHADEIDTITDRISLLRALSMAVRSITALVRAHQVLGGDTHELSRLLNQAIAEVGGELHSSLPSDSSVSQNPGEK